LPYGDLPGEEAARADVPRMHVETSEPEPDGS
jgi:hypothetical protein